MDGTLFLLAVICWLCGAGESVCFRNEDVYIVNLPKEAQRHQLKKARQKCENEAYESGQHFAGSHCNQTFDGVMCWPNADAGTVLVRKCPSYINGFNTLSSAKRTCLPNGHWYIHENTNTTWTDYTQCLSPSKSSIIPDHIPRIRTLYNIGYGISLVSLLLAVFIMIAFKRLHCERNMLHVNLFISFILRAVVCFVKDVEFIPEGDVFVHDDNIHIRSRGATWGCKLLYTLFHYFLTANYFWIFIEGLYLHILIFEISQHKKKLFRYIVIFGWSSPLLFIIPWAVVRAIYEDSLCWSTHDPEMGIYWIIKGPIVISIVINFLLFLNVIRVLFTKLSAVNIRNPKRYRKLAKATLILIPLFGVHYITFIAIPNCLEDEYQVVRLYIEMTLNSFQGFVVALLFCFLNKEVRGEFKKKWKKRVLRRQSLVSNKSYKSQTEVIKLENSPKQEIRIQRNPFEDHSNGKITSMLDPNDISRYQYT